MSSVLRDSVQVEHRVQVPWRPGSSRLGNCILIGIGVSSLAYAWLQMSGLLQLYVALLAQIPLIVAYVDWQRACYAPVSLRRLQDHLANRVPCQLRVSVDATEVLKDLGVIARDGDLLRFEGLHTSFDLGPQDVPPEHRYGESLDTQEIRYVSQYHDVWIHILPYWKLDSEDKVHRPTLLRHLLSWISAETAPSMRIRRPLAFQYKPKQLSDAWAKSWVCLAFGIALLMVAISLFSSGAMLMESPLFLAIPCTWKGVSLLAKASNWRTRVRFIGNMLSEQRRRALYQ